MDRDAFLQQLFDNPSAASDLLQEPLLESDAEYIVAGLKAEADRHWYIDPNCSLAYADMIVQIGQVRNDLCQIGLGMMARGDAIKLLGRMQEAWETLDAAGTVFHCAGNEIGWARTRIGRLYISVELDRVEQAFAEAEQAREIFIRHGETDKLIRLDINIAALYNFLGDHQKAISRYEDVLARAEALEDTGINHVISILGNLGYAYDFLGDFRQALAYHQRAHELLVNNQQTSGAALAELNIARIVLAQGHYRLALQLLHKVETLTGDQLPKEATLARRAMVECYLALNRYAEARDLAQQVVEFYKKQGASYEAAMTLMFLGKAEAELGHYDAAQAALDEAVPIYNSRGATTWAATAALHYGQIALKCGDTDTACSQAKIAMRGFEDRRVSYAEALLLEGQTSFAEGKLDDAERSVKIALDIAHHNSIPSLRYSTHLLLGRIAEEREQLTRAMRHYAAADATIQRMQRGLTITLRPGFLEDKGDALRALIRLHLHSNRVARAFETLERAKSQTLLNYLGNREQLHWADDDPRNRSLIEELNQLREEHHWLYRVAHGQSIDKTAIDPQQALVEMGVRERRMRAITEQLYLHSRSEGYDDYAPVPSAEDIRANLIPGALLVEYYNDGTNVWAFTLDAEGLQVHSLPITVAALDLLVDKFRRYIDRALRAHHDVMPQLTQATQQTAGQLYRALLQPLESRLACCRQLIMIPYGTLHYLPFHLLYNGNRYLIEDYEVVTLPSASLVKHRGPERSGGALVLAHSQAGTLPQTLAEGRVVRELFGGSLLVEEQANRSALMAEPRQILHIAAHGEHRIDQPDFSYIGLADGHLLSDDVIQHDLSYELVTLSACETGLARVAPGDELIGLGRGFLYAGAGALVASLWRVNDQTATQLMEYVYSALWAGESKSAALRQAQCTILRQKPDLHPAFWGAFQLVGDPSPLTVKHREVQGEIDDVVLRATV